MDKYSLLLLLFPVFFNSGILSAEPLNQSADDSVYLHNRNYRLQTDLYDIYKTKKAEIVMLGNSITHGVNWSELLDRTDVVERGIPSDVLQGFLNRMDYIYKLQPSVCFIMGGINDIYSGIPVDTVFSRYKKIISGLTERKIRPVIQSTLYVSPKWHDAAEKNIDVEKLNKMLLDFSAENKIDFVDLNKILSKNKLLIDKYTFDGVHLTGEAYKLWAVEIEKVLKRMGK